MNSRKRNFRLIIVLMAIAIFVGANSFIFAAGDKPLVSLFTKQDKVIAEHGDKVILTLSAKNLEVDKEGMNAYIGKLEYDKNVFDALTKDSFKELNGWTELEYNPETEEFISYGTSRITSDMDLLQITFKVKENAKEGDTSINVKDFIASEGNKDFDYEQQVDVAKKTEVTATVNIPEKENSGDSGDSGNTGSGEDSGDSGNTGSGEGSGDSGSTGSGEDSGDSGNTGNGGDSGNSGNTGNGGDSGNSGNTGNGGDSGNSGNTGNGGNSGNSGNTGNGGNSGNSGNTGNTGGTSNSSSEEGNSHNNTGNGLAHFNTGGTLLQEIEATVPSRVGAAGEETEEEKNKGTGATSSIINKPKTVTEFVEETIPEQINRFSIYWIIPPIVFLILDLFIFLIYKRRKKETSEESDKTKKNIFRSISLVLISSTILSFVSVPTRAMKISGEINGDYVVNYDDIKLLERYLIGLHPEFTDSQKINADIDTDGYLSVNDLSLVIEKTVDPSSYTATLNDVEASNWYPQKGDTLRFYFNADITDGETPVEMLVNGEEYTVAFDETKNKYYVDIETPEKGGQNEIKFECASLSNGELASIDHTETVVVKRDPPTISDYEIREDHATGNVTINFNLNDPDDSYKPVTNNFQVWRTSPSSSRDGLTSLVVGANTVTFRALNNASYRVEIRPDYYVVKDSDLLSGKDPTGNKEVKKNYDQSYTYRGDYDIQFSDLQTYKTIDMAESSASNTFGRNEYIYLGFSFSNKYDVALKNIKINGRGGYTAVKMADGKYRIALNGIFAAGNNTIEIQEVTLENNSVVEVSESLPIVITNARPEVKTPALIEDANTLKVMTDIIDRDNALSSAQITVSTAEGNNLIDEEMEEGVPFNKTIDTGSNVLTASYKVKVVGTFDLGIGETTETLYEGTFAAIPKAVLKDVVLQKNSFEKDENISIGYDLKYNSNGVDRVTVNGTQISGGFDAIGIYNITMKAPRDAEVYPSKYDITLNSVKLKNNNIEAVIVDDGNKATQKIEILKSIPEIDEYSAVDGSNSATFKFNVEDPDNAFTTGKVELRKVGQTDVVATGTFDAAGEQSVTVNDLEVLIPYDVKIIASYKRGEADDTVGEAILNQSYELVGDYQLEINDISTFKPEESETATNIFEKSETIRVTFTSTNVTSNRSSGPKYYPEKIKIDGNWYELVNEENNTYSVEIPAGDEANAYNKPIEAVIFDNTAEVTVTGKTIDYEVLKTAPRASDVVYELDESSTPPKIALSFKLVDDDATLEGGKAALKVYDITNNNNVVLQLDDLGTGDFSEEISALTDHKYQVELVGTYYLDQNKTDSHKFENNKFLDLEIDTGARLYEIKDINEIKLYKKTGSDMELQGGVTVSDVQSNKDNYVAQVIPRQQPAFYANILEAYEENNALKLKLDYDNVIYYDGQARKSGLVVDYGTINDGVAENDNFENLMKRIEENPAGEFVLHSDLDASDYRVSTSAMLNLTFTGTLDGQGHTIKNLTKPIFNKIGTNSTVKNLIIDKAIINNSGSRGTVANDAEGATIDHVFVTNAKITGRNDHVGGVVGNSKSTTISNVAVTGLSFTGGNLRLGGIVGSTGKTTIKNVYVMGSLGGGGDHAGGIAGSIEDNSHINGAISNVELSFGNGGGSKSGVVGIIFGYNSSIKNTLSLVSAANYNRINGGTSMSATYNNYSLLASESIRGNENEIKEKDINDKFFTNKLMLSEEAWQIKATSSGKLPILLGGDPRGASVAGSTAKDGVYIPDYDVVKNLGNYERDKDKLYSNLYKLMPFYESKNLIEDGAKINRTSKLYTNEIIGIIPYADKNENDREVAIVGLSKNNPEKLKYIKVLFDDDKYEKYPVTFKSKGGNDETIATYYIPSLRIDYNYDKYLVDTDDELYTGILNDVRATDYQRDLNPLTPEDETRNYYENYQRVLDAADDFTLNLMANNPDYNVINTDGNENHKSLVRAALSNDKQLKKLLYTYNYFDRFYDIEIGGVNMRDVVYFDGRPFSSALNSINMTELMMAKQVSSDGKCDRYTWNTRDYYNNTISGYTGKSLGDFLEYYMVNVVSDEEYNIYAQAYREKTGQKPDKANAWMHSNFNGYIYEAPAEDFKDFEAAARGESRKFLEYRAWYHIKRMYSGSYILPFLTYDRDNEFHKDLYLVTYPTAIMYGNLRPYNFSGKTYNWDNEQPSAADLKKKIADFTDGAAKLYNTMGHIVNDATFERMNGKTDVVHDSTGNAYSADMIGKTNEPVYKYINEVQNQWHRHNSAAAYANTVGGVFYCFYRTLDSYSIWTHENIHNQDTYLYIENNGKRHPEPENFTDGILTQAADRYLTVPNFSADYSWETNVSINQTTDRFKSTETQTGRDRYGTWYKNAYEAIRLMDYLEGKAFFELTPQEQAALATQVNYTNKEQNPTIITTSKSRLTPEELTRYNVQDFGDLYDYRITLERGGGVIINSYWFIPTNDTNTITNESFKRNAHEMSAEGGYQGFVDWSGNKYKNDLDALRGITKIPNNTWRDHQINKYEYIGEKLKDNAYFNEDELIAWIKEGLERDAAKGDLSTNSAGVTNREILYTHLKRITNDFERSIFDPVPSIKINTAQQLVDAINAPLGELGVYELTQDINFADVSGGDTSYIEKTFFGELKSEDNNKFAIKGLTKPLFNKVMYASIENIKIEDAVVTSTVANANTGSLMNYGYFDTIKNIDGKNITLTGAGTDGGLIGLIDYSYVEGIEVSSVKIKSTVTQTAGIIGRSNYSRIKDIHLNQDGDTVNTIDGTDRVGGAIGYVENMYSVEIGSSIANITATGNAVGGFIGEIVSSKVSDCYAIGKVNANKHSGGFTGYVNNSNITNCYSKVDLSVKSGGSGGLLGTLVTRGSVENSITYGNISSGNAYKFDGESAAGIINNGFSNNYEHEFCRGNTTRNRTDIEWDGKVDEVSAQRASEETFYTETLNWDSEKWIFDNVAGGGLPKLKSERDKKDIKSIITKVDINTASDLLKINDDPYGEYTLKANINLADIEDEIKSNTYVTVNFAGVFEGGDYTISNLSRPIFNNVNNATIKNLNIENANIDILLATKTGSLMNEGNNDTITNITARNLTIYGRGIDGGLIGRIDNSTIEGIDVSLVNVTSTANYTGGIIGYVENSVLRDIHLNQREDDADNTVTGTGNYAGGAFGYIRNSDTVERCSAIAIVSGTQNANGNFVGQFANSKARDCYAIGSVSGSQYIGGFAGWVENAEVVNCYTKTAVTSSRGGSGGFLGTFRGTAFLNNCVSYSSSTNNNAFKFDGDTAANIVAEGYSNNFELKESIGRSSLTRNGSIDWEGKLTELELETAVTSDFYATDLGWDTESVWSIEEIATGALPKLNSEKDNKLTVAIIDGAMTMSLDEDEEDEEVEAVEVNTAVDLLDEINENPDAVIEIIEDLDFSDIEAVEESYIDNFNGVINGNGHTISLLKKPLINEAIGASIDDVKIIGAEIETDSDVAGALINSGTDIVLTNIVASDIKILGSGILGGLAGSLDGAYISCVSVNDIEVRSNGIKPVGGFVGGIEKGDSENEETIIDNIYVSGKIILENSGEDGSAVGGVIGKDNGSTISHAIVNVNIISNSVYLDSEVYGVVEGSSEGDEDLEDPQPQDISEGNGNISEDSGSGNASGDESGGNIGNTDESNGGVIPDNSDNNQSGNGSNSSNGDSLDESNNGNKTDEDTLLDSDEEEEDLEESEDDLEDEEHTIRVYRTRWNVGKLIGCIDGESYISNSVIYGVASGDAIIGKGQATEINEVYQYKDLTVADIMNKELFESLGFEKDIWNFDNLGLGGPGLLSAEDNVSIIPIGVENINGQTSIQEALVSFACQFVGNPYVYGGTSLTNGADCSGFVMTVFSHFGVTGLPHSSAALRNVGSEVSISDIQPGDILCFSGHVGIAMGDGYMVHASNERDGIKISSLDNYNIITVRRVL